VPDFLTQTTKVPPDSPDKVDTHSLNSSVIAATSSYSYEGTHVALAIQQHD